MINKKLYILMMFLIIFVSITAKFNMAIAEQITIPYFLKPNMKLNIQEEAIEKFASEYGWQKTRELTREASYSIYEEEGVPIGVYVRGTLWTPTIVWIEEMSEADLYLETKEKAINEYEIYERYFKKGNLSFTLLISGISKDEVSLDNLNFVLEDEKNRRWRAENTAKASSRGIESRSALGFTVYSNTIDIDFIPPRKENPNWGGSESLKLYVIYEYPRRRVELTWEFNHGFYIEKQIDKYVQKQLKDTNIKGFLSNTLKILKNNIDDLKNLEITSLKPTDFKNEDDYESKDRNNFFTVTLEKDDVDKAFTLYVEILDLYTEKQQVFIQLNKSANPWSLFTIWDKEESDFKIIKSDYKPTFFPYFNIIPFQFDNNKFGLIVDESFGSIMNYKVLKYKKQNEYKKVWEQNPPPEGYFSTDEISLGSIKHIELYNWDHFPADIYPWCTYAVNTFARKFEVEYNWDKNKETFIEVKREEIMYPFAIVNHFIKAIQDEKKELALKYLNKSDKLYYDLLKCSKPNIEYPFLFKNKLVFLWSKEKWLEKVDYLNVDDSNEVVVIGITQIKNEDIKDEDIKELIIFELIEQEEPKIVDVYHYTL